MIRLLVWLALIVGFIWFGSTVKLGNRTFFGHVRAIWHTEEVQDLKHGVQGEGGAGGPKRREGRRGRHTRR